LRRNYATDVLAFDLKEDIDKPKMKSLSGDVIISTDAALKYCRINKASIKHELILYVVHGILHPNGYDDHSSKDTAKMRKREEKIMTILGKRIEKAVR